jgi:hypothetical protein
VSDPEYQRKRALECLRLASDLSQLARNTVNPHLKAHCLRMANLWSAQAEQRSSAFIGIRSVLVHWTCSRGRSIRIHGWRVRLGGRASSNETDRTSFPLASTMTTEPSLRLVPFRIASAQNCRAPPKASSRAASISGRSIPSSSRAILSSLWM